MSNWSVAIRYGNSWNISQQAALSGTTQPGYTANEVYARLRSNLSREQAESIASFINLHFLERNYATAERD